jgi:DNA-binding transcriptional ArsR family regulator
MMLEIAKAETVFKGAASSKRLRILSLISDRASLSIAEITEILKIDFRNTSQHIAKLERAGLLLKKHDGNFVRLALSHRGKSILEFYRILE